MASLYPSAAKVLDKILKKKGTVKSLVIDNDFPNKKILYAVVCETLKYRKTIEEILNHSKLLKLEKQLKLSLALVLVYEFLFGHGLKCGGKFKQCITRNKSGLNAALARIKIRAKVTSNADLVSTKAKTAALIPRYARVNLLLTSMENVTEQLKSEGFVMSNLPKEKSKKVEKSFYIDQHIPDVIVFPPGTDLHDHPLYVKGHIILQDKASCLPAHVINPPPGSHVIDACAAPGNKTSHLASHMNNKGKIYAFDTDSHRLSTMKKLMTTAGVDCVTMRNASFLEVDPSSKEYQNVEYIVVDPSCSGSGIVSRMDYLTDEPQDEDFQQRLESLSEFQLTALTHALSFPSVKKVVYSTCSIHKKENEDVVEKALDNSQGKFELSHIMDTWTNRGLAVFPGAEKCIRASPEADQTNGFFVAMFTRKKEDVISKLDQVTSCAIYGTQQDVTCVRKYSLKRKNKIILKEKAKKTKLNENSEESYKNKYREGTLDLTENDRNNIAVNKKNDAQLEALQNKSKKKSKKKRKKKS